MKRSTKFALATVAALGVAAVAVPVVAQQGQVTLPDGAPPVPDDPADRLGLLERSGFQREGCLRSYRVGRGQAHDFYVYSRLRSDYPCDREARDREALGGAIGDALAAGAAGAAGR